MEKESIIPCERVECVFLTPPGSARRRGSIALIGWIAALDGITLGTQEMQRYVWSFADHPAVVTNRRNVKQGSGRQLYDSTIVESGSRCTRDDKAYVLHCTSRRVDRGSDMLRPSPPGFVGRAADRKPADPYNLKPAAGELANFVCGIESFHDHVNQASIIHRVLQADPQQRLVIVCGRIEGRLVEPCLQRNHVHGTIQQDAVRTTA
jgi:hypothetical protein